MKVEELKNYGRPYSEIMTEIAGPMTRLLRKEAPGIVRRHLGLRDRMEEKGIELVVADQLPTVRCDRDRIRGEDRVPCVLCRGQRRVGIEAKHHRRIFEMFYRVKGTEEKEGTGLGLAIVARIVRAHGGKVWVESERGKGAIFYFSLPRA